MKGVTSNKVRVLLGTGGCHKVGTKYKSKKPRKNLLVLWGKGEWGEGKCRVLFRERRVKKGLSNNNKDIV